MIHPVQKAVNAAAREHYYGFLSEKQFPHNPPPKQDGGTGYYFKGPDKGSGGSKVPAKPKKPTPTIFGERALVK